MKAGLLAKFSENVHCLKQMDTTNDTVLVESSQYDKFWGVSLAVKDTDLANIQMWKGKNLMGDIFQEIGNELVG